MSDLSDRVTEAVAAALFEQATWHPPARGKDWSEATFEQKQSWLPEAEDLLDPLVARVAELEAEVVQMRDTIGHPPLRPRPGKTIRDEMQELTDLYDEAEEARLRLGEMLTRMRNYVSFNLPGESHAAAERVKLLSEVRALLGEGG